MNTTQLNDSHLSPIYRDLYNRVAALPAFLALEEQAHEALRNASVVEYTYRKGQYRNKVVCLATINIGGHTRGIQFPMVGTETPSFLLDVSHLVSESDLLDIYFNNVGRQGKPICPHGLVKEDTVRHGAEPRGKNKFSPWATCKILGSDSFESLKERTKQRIFRYLVAELTADPGFVQFSEDLQMGDIVNKFSKYSHLPPDLLHRAIDLMYVQDMMEK